MQRTSIMMAGWTLCTTTFPARCLDFLKNENGKSFADETWTSKMGSLSRNLSEWSIGFVDFNNDGWKDVYSANGDVDNLTAKSPQHDTMFQNIDGKTLVD